MREDASHKHLFGNSRHIEGDRERFDALCRRFHEALRPFLPDVVRGELTHDAAEAIVELAARLLQTTAEEEPGIDLPASLPVDDAVAALRHALNESRRDELADAELVNELTRDIGPQLASAWLGLIDATLRCDTGRLPDPLHHHAPCILEEAENLCLVRVRRRIRARRRLREGSPDQLALPIAERNLFGRRRLRVRLDLLLQRRPLDLRDLPPRAGVAPRIVVDGVHHEELHLAPAARQVPEERSIQIHPWQHYIQASDLVRHTARIEDRQVARP